MNSVEGAQREVQGAAVRATVSTQSSPALARSSPTLELLAGRLAQAHFRGGSAGRGVPAGAFAAGLAVRRRPGRSLQLAVVFPGIVMRVALRVAALWLSLNRGVESFFGESPAWVPADGMGNFGRRCLTPRRRSGGDACVCRLLPRREDRR
jgi:hypothetical protein